MADVLDAFVAGLGERFASIAACGIPDTLVHGDSTRATSAARRSGSRCSTGATRASASRCSTCRRSSPRSRTAARGAVRDRWIGAWRERLPGADPERAATLLAPVAAARQAVVYQRFVDGIEPVERRHHDADAREWLGRCAALVEGERGTSAG